MDRGMTNEPPKMPIRAELERIYREHRQGLFTLALSITRQAQAAEDAVQEAFARLCKRDRLADGDATAYTFATVRNMALDWVRSPQRHRTGSDTIFEITQATNTAPPDARTIADERDRLVRDVVDGLPDDQREVLVMKLYAGLTFEQIAAALDEPLSTVSSRYQRTLDKLRTKIEALV